MSLRVRRGSAISGIGIGVHQRREISAGRCARRSSRQNRHEFTGRRAPEGFGCPAQTCEAVGQQIIPREGRRRGPHIVCAGGGFAAALPVSTPPNAASRAARAASARIATPSGPDIPATSASVTSCPPPRSAQARMMMMSRAESRPRIEALGQA